MSSDQVARSAGQATGPKRFGARFRRALPLAAAVIASGLLIAGCGGGSKVSSTRQSRVTSFAERFVAFAVCMRSHGLAGYPDPHVSGSGTHDSVTISPGSLDPNSPAFRSAEGGCHHLLPDGGGPAAGASPEEQAQDLRFANCMRAHGVPNFPDPDHNGAFTLPAAVNQQAPQFQRAEQACMSVEPGSLSILDQSPG